MPSWITRRSTVGFVVVCLILVGIKCLFDFYPGDFPGKGQTAAFEWPIVIGVILLGVGGLHADRALALPESFASANRERKSAFWAVTVGIIYGCITVANAIYQPGERSPVALVDWPHLELPWSIPFYTFGAILLEFLLRLGALCILVWFIHRVVLRGRFFVPVFWSVNLIVSLYEVWPWMMRDAERGDWGQVALGLVVDPLYLSNVFEGWLLLRFGWFSPILFRLSFYLVWHILYGGLARPF